MEAIMGLAEKRKRLRTPKGFLQLTAVALALMLLLVGGHLLTNTDGKVKKGFSLQEGTSQVGGGNSSNPNVGQLAPDFTLTDLEGEPVKLSDLRGRAVLLNFWASWCPPCRAEMPDLQEAHEKYSDGIRILAVNIQEDKEAVKNFVQEFGLTFTVLLDSDGSVARTYRIAAIPTSFFIDRNGIIRLRWVGALSKQALEAGIRAATKGGE